MVFSYSGDNRVTTLADDCTPNKPVSLEELVELIQNPTPAQWALITEIRAEFKLWLAAGKPKTKPEAKYSVLKKRLPYFLVSGHCPIGHDNKSLQPNFHLQLDLDDKNIGGEHRMREAKKDAAHLKYMVLANQSATNHGLKMVVRVLLENVPATSTPAEYFKANFKAIERYAKQKVAGDLGVATNDIDGLSLSQPCFPPYGAGLYYELDADPITVDVRKLPKLAHTAVLRAVTELRDSQHAPAIKIALGEVIRKHGEYGEDARHTWLVSFSSQCNILGVPMQVVMDYVRKNCPHEIYESTDYQRQVADPYKRWAASHGLESWRVVSVNAPIKIENPSGKKLGQIRHPELDTKQAYSNVFLQGQCGLGKTTDIIHKTLNVDCKCLIIALPTQGQVAAQHAKYEDRYKTMQVRQGYPPLFRDKTTGELAAQPDLIFCTGKSLPRLVNSLINSGYCPNDYRLFFDEVHMAAQAYKSEETRLVYKYIDLYFNDVIYATATPVTTTIPALSQCQVLEVSPSYRTPISLIKSEPHAPVLAMLAQNSLKQKRQVFILLNDIRAAQRVVERLGSRAMLLCSLSSVPAGVDADAIYKVFKTGEFPAGVDVFVCTSVAEMGMDFYNTAPCDYYIASGVNPPHACNIAQFAGRGRNHVADGRAFVVGNLEAGEHVNGWRDVLKLAVLRHATGQVSHRNSQLKASWVSVGHNNHEFLNTALPPLLAGFGLEDLGGTRLSYVDGEGFRIDYVSCDALIHSVEKSKMQSWEVLKVALERYALKWLGVHVLDIEKLRQQIKEDAAEISADKKLVREREAAEWAGDCKMAETDGWLPSDTRVENFVTKLSKYFPADAPPHTTPSLKGDFWRLVANTEGSPKRKNNLSKQMYFAGYFNTFNTEKTKAYWAMYATLGEDWQSMTQAVTKTKEHLTTIMGQEPKTVRQAAMWLGLVFGKVRSVVKKKTVWKFTPYNECAVMAECCVPAVGLDARVSLLMHVKTSFNIDSTTFHAHKTA